MDSPLFSEDEALEVPAAAKAPDALGMTLQELQCPICVETIQDPFVTSCGHTFCHSCLSRHLANKKTCPSCSGYLTTSSIFPNFLLSKVLKQAAQTSHATSSSFLDRVKHMLETTASELNAAELEATIAILADKQRQVQQLENVNNLQLLLLFLQHARVEKAAHMQELQQQLQCLQQDLSAATGQAGAAQPLLLDTDAQAQQGVSSSDAGQPAGPAAITAAGCTGSTPQPATSGTQQHSGEVLPGKQAQPASSQPTSAAAMFALPSSVGTAVAAAQAMQPAEAPGHAMGTHVRSAFTAVPHRDSPTSAPPPAGAAAAGAAARPPAPALVKPESSAGTHAAHGTGNAQQQQQQQQGATSNGNTPTPAGSHPLLLAKAKAHSSPDIPALVKMQPGTHASAAASPASNTAAQPPRPPLPTSSSQRPQSSDGHAIRRASSAGNLQQLNQHQQPAGSAAQLLAGGTGPGRPGGALAPSLAPCSDISTAAMASDNIAAAARAAKRRRIMSQFDDLQQCYFKMRLQQQGAQQQPEQAQQGTLSTQQTASAAWAAGPGPEPVSGLNDFTHMLTVATRCTRLSPLAVVRNTTGRSSAIISSLDLDSEQRLFASAGVLQRVSLYDFQDVVSKPAGTAQAPVRELASRFKLSSLGFSPFVRQQLLVSDYEGVVTLWDVEAGQAVREFEAHSKRIWSIDCSKTERGLFATASDDCRVKVWKDDQPDRCQLSIDVKANACCVQCSPSDSHTIVVGSANHNLHMYDLRAPRDPLRTFKGHAKTISYVQFMPGGQELVSASTDSTVRLWSVSSSECVATYTGHVNEKNFVGLAAAGEFVACGSETNEVVVYYKPMSAPLLRYSLSPVEALLGESSGHFVTALRWKGEGQALLAANSQGHIWVLGLGQ